MEVNPHPPSDSLMDDSEISLTVELEYQQALRPCGDMSKLYCQRSADRPYNTEIVFISQNEGKSLRKDFQI